jgi:hypothetical protein
MGTDFFEGGRTWVGEHGPEIVELPRGSRILNNQESMGQRVNHTGVIRVEGYNQKGEFDRVVEIVMDNLRREVRS